MAQARRKTQAAPVVELLTLNAKAAELAKLGDQAGLTLQAPAKGLGLAWRNAQHKAPNTRARALAAIQAAHPEGCTMELAIAALQAAKQNGLNLGSGTPRSYVKAFMANGYLA
jgi:2-hydroxychromene-2-carboxylate isomerase